MGFVTDAEAAGWTDWLADLLAQRRVLHKEGRWFAVDATAEPKKVLLGRLEALGPVFPDDQRIAMGGAKQALLLELEHEGAILRTRLEGRTAWCERRLLARIHRYTLDTLRQQIEPVTASGFLQFLACWQHVDEQYRLEGPRGVAEVLGQLAGFELPAWAWESHILTRRVRDYRREWLDEITLSGEFAWGRLWGGAATPIRVTPISFIPREQIDSWLAPGRAALGLGHVRPGQRSADPVAAQGAMFPQNLQQAANLVPAHFEMGLADLVSHGWATCDSFGALRQMITPPSRRKAALRPVGRWSCFRTAVEAAGLRRAGRAGRPPAPAPHRRGLPPHARARAAPRELAQAHPHLPPPGTARRSPRRPLRRRLLRRTIRPARSRRAAAPPPPRRPAPAGQRPLRRPPKLPGHSHSRQANPPRPPAGSPRRMTLSEPRAAVIRGRKKSDKRSLLKSNQ